MLSDSSPAPDPLPDQTQAFSQDYMRILRRRRAVIVQSFVLITVVAIVVTLMTKPVYQARARLLVENPTASYNAIDTANPLSGILALSQPQTVATQVEVLQSPSLQQQVIEKVGTATLAVDAVQDTNVIEATAESNDPTTAANAANTLLQLYIEQDTNRSLTEIRSAEEFAKHKEADARQQLGSAAAQLEAFRKQHHVADLNAERSAEIQRSENLRTDVKTAATNLAAYKSQKDVLQQQLNAQPTTLTTQVQTTNTHIDSINEQIANLQLQRRAMTGRGGYTAKAPQVIALDNQLAQLQARLAAQPHLSISKTIAPNARPLELKKAMDDIDTQIASTKTVLAHKQQELADTQAKVGQYAQWDTQLNRLTFAANGAATTDNMFQSKLADLSLREQAHHATARIDEVAQVPLNPVRPKKAVNIALGCLFGLFVGILMALLQEYLDDRINSVDDADRVLGLPSLGYAPTLSASDARLLPQMQGMDPAAESYRLLRTNIQFAAIDQPVHTLLVTSSSPGEGKTTTAANLAFAMVADGKRVVLVDTDLRRPSLHKLLELPTTPGLTDVLLGRATLDQTLLQHEQMPNLMTLTSGSTPPNPGELLNSRAFRNLVDELKEMCDIVIFDSPPVLVAADAAILASQMDGTVMVIETGETRKAPARQSLALLRKGRANILGVMYNKMRALDGREYYYYRYQYSTAAPTTDSKNGKPPKALSVSDDASREPRSGSDD